MLVKIQRMGREPHKEIKDNQRKGIKQKRKFFDLKESLFNFKSVSANFEDLLNKKLNCFAVLVRS